MGGALTRRLGRSPAVAGTIRTSNITTVTSTNTAAISFPAGATAGDYCVIFSSHGWDTTVPVGWTTLDQPVLGSNFNGATFAKTLSSGDISTGSVTVNYGGTSSGVAGCVVFVGAMTGLRAKASIRRGPAGATTSGALTTDASPQAGDIGLYWGSLTIGPTTVTLDRGSTLQTQSNSASAAILASETLASGGVKTLNVDYHATATGDYSINCIIQP